MKLRDFKQRLEQVMEDNQFEEDRDFPVKIRIYDQDYNLEDLDVVCDDTALVLFPDRSYEASPQELFV